MGRPVKCRKICCVPTACVFKPLCSSMKELEEIELAADEMEAMRLADFEGLYQFEAAASMGISRQTFGKIIAQARKKVTLALIGGKSLRIGYSRTSPPQTEEGEVSGQARKNKAQRKKEFLSDNVTRGTQNPPHPDR